MKYHDSDPTSGIDPLKSVDNNRVAQYVQFRFLNHGNRLERLTFLYQRQRAKDRELLEILEAIGTTVEHKDAVIGIDEEMPTYNAFLAGLTVALETIDSILFELGIKPRDFRQFWADSDDFVQLALPPNREDYSQAQLHQMIGRTIIEDGERYLYAMDPQYQTLIERIDDMHILAATQSHVFKASYGFVAGTALDVLGEMLQAGDLNRFETEIYQLDVDWDDLLKDGD